MAQRYDYFFRQKITEAELDAGFAGLENADRALATDLNLVGVAYGLALAEQSVPNLTLQLSGPGAAFDQVGQRIYVATTQNVNMALDEGALSTAVVAPGNTRWLSVFVEFDRTLTDPRVDGDSNTVYYNRAESFTINVVAGAESAGTPTRPVLRSDQILIGDVILAYGATAIHTADVSSTRRQWMFKTTTGGAFDVASGRVSDALTALVTRINTLAAGAGISYAGGAAWADGTTNPATTVEAQLDKIITDLTSTSGNRGLGKLTAPARAAWADGTTNVAMDADSALAKIITDLAAAGGLNKLGPLSGTGEILYSAGRSRTILVPLSTFAAKTDDVVTPFLDSSGALRLETNFAFVAFPLSPFLRSGETITAFSVLVGPGAARATGSDRMKAILQYQVPDFSVLTNNPVNNVQLSTQTDVGTAVIQPLAASGLTHAVDLSIHDYFITVRAGSTAGDGLHPDNIYAVKITVTDVGPRNF